MTISVKCVEYRQYCIIVQMCVVFLCSVPARAREELPKMVGSREDSSSTGTDSSRGKGVVENKAAGSGHGRGMGRGKDASSETGSLSSLSQSSLGGRAGGDSSNQLHHAYLEVVYSLSSDVALRKNTATLNM